MSLRWARWSNILTKGGSSLSPVTATMSCLCLWVTRKCLNHQDLDICEKHDFLSILLRFNGGKTVYWQQQAARAAQAGPNKNSDARQASLTQWPLTPACTRRTCCEHISRHFMKLPLPFLLSQRKSRINKKFVSVHKIVPLNIFLFCQRK